MKKSGFSKREVRAIVFLVPFVLVLGLIVRYAMKPRIDDGVLLLADTPAVVRDRERVVTAGADRWTNEEDKKPLKPFVFDPNEVTYEEMRRMNIPKRTAAGIVKYRLRGKVFTIPEEFAACYGISDSMYFVLRPYIVIGEKYRIEPSNVSQTRFPRDRSDVFPDSTVTPFPDLPEKIDPNGLDTAEFIALGFSKRQAETILNYRNALGGFRSADDLSRCYVVSDEMFERLAPRLVFADTISVRRPVLPVELNSADSATLDALTGIGPATASAIIAYRQRLGGFVRISQLTELKIINERNYESICKQIRVDSCKIRKIDINFAPPEELSGHPYMTAPRLRKILRYRQLKGGWKSVGELIDEHILTPEEAERLAPYLYFGESAGTVPTPLIERW